MVKRIAVQIWRPLAAALSWLVDVFVPPEAGNRRPILVVCIVAVAYVIVLRLVFSGLIDLIPEEAYYWSYAQHIDIGYLDHPPIVAWLIWLSTTVLGNSEFSVRLPAFICWLITAFFVFRLASNLIGKPSALQSVLLVAALPVYFSIGCLMTPDAPLYAAWGGCVYFLERALVAQKRRAWWGVGFCMGLGMLSKYTIVLLGPAAVAFLLADRKSRRWLLRPEPYLAALTAVILFCPVLLWNYKHDWASFVFQGPRRWSGGMDFSLHLLLGGALVLLTPVGLYEAVRALFLRWPQKAADKPPTYSVNRQRLFMLICTVLPLLVFVIHSLHSQPKLNWTGPIWLVVVPLVAWSMSLHPGERVSRWTRLIRTAWFPTIFLLLVFYTVGLGYIYLGLPGFPSQTGMPLPVAWEEFGRKIVMIKHRVKSETGSEPLIVGMDKYWISSELSFYDNRNHSALPAVGGQHLLGKESLMWKFWVPKQAALGRNILIVSFNSRDLENSQITKHFSKVSEVSTEAVRKGEHVVTYFSWRVGYGYRE